MFFTRGPSDTLRLALFAIAAIALMALDQRQHHLETLRAGLSLFLSPVQYAMTVPQSGMEWLDESITSRERLERENAELRARQLLTQARLQKLETLESENARLRALLESSARVAERMMIAELLDVSLEPFAQKIMIDKGGRHDVHIGQPLLDAAGVMGQIEHVTPLNSTAILITDPGHSLPVRVDRNGLRAIAKGTGDPNQLEIAFLSHNADIVKGDLLTTSGLGGGFPPGYPVARVESIEHPAGQPYARIIAKPTADISAAREVVLVWPLPAPAPPATEPAR